MGTKAIDPQSIRNVTIIGDPDETTRVARRMFGGFAGTGSSTVHWVTGRVDHTIRIAELSSHAPIATLERSIRVADGVIAVVNAAVKSAPRLETILRVADDHQVARLCLVTGLDDPAADFDRCVRMIADARGAVPLTLQIPLGIGTEFEGDIDPVLGPPEIPSEQLHDRIRRLTRTGDAVPVLCYAAQRSDDIAPLLDAIVRYLPSPMQVCQPEHALNY